MTQSYGEPRFMTNFLGNYLILLLICNTAKQNHKVFSGRILLQTFPNFIFRLFTKIYVNVRLRFEQCGGCISWCISCKVTFITKCTSILLLFAKEDSAQLVMNIVVIRHAFLYYE